MKSSYIPVSFKFGDVLQAEYVTAVNKLLRCFDPETVGATLKGHHGIFRHWCHLGYLLFTVGSMKFRLENPMVCAIPFGRRFIFSLLSLLVAGQFNFDCLFKVNHP